jgi:hypothetical protein
VRGEFVVSPDIGTYAFDMFANDSGSVLFDPLLPATPGSGLWYLMRPRCAAGSWTSGGPSEAGGRDVALDTCMPGGVTFGFSGALDVFVAPCSGTFTLEAWGAQGGGPDGGLGGYAAGTITLSAGDTLEVRVGGQTGWSGGGAGWAAAPRNGGGATDFRRGGSGLADRILVAGGGGAGGATDVGPITGGAGGGGACAFPYCGGGGAAGYGGSGADGALGGGAGNASCHSGGAGGGGSSWTGSVGAPSMSGECSRGTASPASAGSESGSGVRLRIWPLLYSLRARLAR